MKRPSYRAAKDLTRELTQTQVRSVPYGALPGRIPSESVYHGEFYAAGRWNKVENNSGNVMAYASEEAAVAGAKLRHKEFLERGQQCDA